jgi:hypothetical protein
MATLTWTGGESATTKTFMTAANWGGTAPSNDDTLIINSSSDTIGGAATGLTGITLRVGSGFTGVLGSSTTYLDLDGPVLEFAASSRGHYLTGTWTNVRILGGASVGNFLNFKDNASTAITTLTCTRLQSTVTIGSSASLTTVNMNGLQTGTVDIKSGVSSLATINCTSGQVLVASTCTTANALGGTITSSGTAAFTNVECDGLGSFEHLSSGTITNLEVYNGTFDHRANETAGFTLTNATVYRGGEIRGDGSLDNVTYTNGVSLQGGLATFPIGSTVTIS